MYVQKKKSRYLVQLNYGNIVETDLKLKTQTRMRQIYFKILKIRTFNDFSQCTVYVIGC